MAIEDIFGQVAQRMIEGLMIHSQLSDYYKFLGLKGYGKCHEYHYFEENSNYMKLCDYYINHYNKIAPDSPFTNQSIIPENWYLFARQDVDMSIRKAAIKTGFERWVDWESKTKKFYEQHYQNLMSLGEIAAACELKKYVLDVDKELANAEQKALELKSIDYNISDIMMEQDDIYKKYHKKLKEIKYD